MEVKELKEGYIFDYISGVQVKATPEEVNAVQVFSKILVEDYNYSKDKIRTRPQYRVKARPSDIKKEYPVDIAVFSDASCNDDSIYIIVECKKPNRKDGKRQLEIYLAMSKAIFGVWYNGNEKLCIKKEVIDGIITFIEIPNIPKSGERFEDIGLYKRKDLIKTHNLKPIFKDIRNYFAANSVGITRDEVFAQQFINLLFCKIYDERFTKPEDIVKFRCGIQEPEEDVAARIKEIFSIVKKQYTDVFADEDQISLDDKSIAYAVAQLQAFCIKDTKRDAIGDAFESFIDYSTKGTQGQFFTPRNVVRLIVEMAQISKSDKLIDPACGTGGFLIEGLKSAWEDVENYGSSYDWPESEVFAEKQRTAIKNIKGIDKDSFLTKVAKAYMALMGDGRGGIFCENSLVNPKEWSEKTRADISLNSFDVVLTNPPFGKKLKIDDREILSAYALGSKWKKEAGEYIQTDLILDAQAPQILFIERCLQLLKDKGRMCFIAPESMFCNPSHRHIVEYIKKYASIQAIISMPEELFQPFTHAKTCVVYLKKISSTKERIKDHSIFMAIARWCGHDSRGLEITKDDLPIIQQRYREYIKTGQLEGYNHLGFIIKESQIVKNIYLPKYYNPEIKEALNSLSSSHNLVTIQQLVDDGVLSISTGDEVKKESYGTGSIPFIRTSDIANWEIKLDPKQGLSEEIYKKYKTKQNVKANDILMVRDGTYLVGTCALITEADTQIVFQSHIYKIRIKKPEVIHPYLLLTLLSSPILKRQIYAKRFTQDIIDTLGERINELVLPIPKDENLRNKIVTNIEDVVKLKARAKQVSREAMFNVAPTELDGDSQFMTLVCD